MPIPVAQDLKTKTDTDYTAHRVQLRFDRGKFATVDADGLNWHTPKRLFGMPLSTARPPEIFHSVCQRAQSGTRSSLLVIDGWMVRAMRADAETSRVVGQADILLPASPSVRWAARLCGQPFAGTISISTLAAELCAHAKKLEQSVFLLSDNAERANSASHALEAAVPGGQIAGAGAIGQSGQCDRAVIETINQSGADIVLIDLPPNQLARWIARNRAALNVPILLGCANALTIAHGNHGKSPHATAKGSTERNLTWLMRHALPFWGLTIHHAMQCSAQRSSHSAKRALDLAIALAACALLGPLFAALCLLITLDDRGPIFFRQTRIGANGKPFNMWKFRSMSVDAEARRANLLDQTERDGVCFKMKRDPRITRVGGWLRRLSLDELPQIINVVQGHMSIVGPRPALPQEVMTYSGRSRQRLLGTPGLTCSWQVSGRAEIPFEQQVEMDIAYLEQRSLIGDIGLIARTVPAVVSGRGAY